MFLCTRMLLPGSRINTPVGDYALSSGSSSGDIYAYLSKYGGETKFRINYLKCIASLKSNLSSIENLLIKDTIY